METVKLKVGKNWLVCRLLEMPEEIAKTELELLKFLDALEEDKKILADKEAALINEGKITGKNDAERRSLMRSLTEEERQKVQKSESELAAFRVYFNRKLNEFSALKAIAKLLSREAE